MLGWEHEGRAGRHLPWGLREEPNLHAMQAGSHSNQHLQLDGWLMASKLTSPQSPTVGTCGSLEEREVVDELGVRFGGAGMSVQ